MPNTYNFPSDKLLSPRTDNSVLKFTVSGGVSTALEIDVSGDMEQNPIIILSTGSPATVPTS